jgi:hypothetical protein
MMNKKELALVILCLIIGFALRFHTFDKKSLWIDEVHTFNDSTHNLQSLLKFYQANPTYLHPPLFFILTHSFYPFPRPERDLRILPLIFGTLSIPMVYLLARQFSPPVAIPCTLSLTMMTYHIYLSQDGRSYSMLLFLGMAGLYFFFRHLATSRNRYLVLSALFYACSFYTSYGSLLLIASSQILWFYQVDHEGHRKLSSFLIFNGMIFALCMPWLLFIALNYHGQPLMDPYQVRAPIFIGDILYGILHDWAPHLPLLIASALLLAIFPFVSKNRNNSLILLSVLLLPVIAVYMFCKTLNVYHFITSKYFINLQPFFFLALYLSLDALEEKLQRLRSLFRLKIIFTVFFIASSLTLLPFYYRSEKQDSRGLVTYLKSHLQDRDKIFIGSLGYIPGILHYFGSSPNDRHIIDLRQGKSGKGFEFKLSFIYQNKIFALYQSKDCCSRYTEDGSRLWIIANKGMAKEIVKKSPCVLKGYFDASFLNYNKFPEDMSMYLFLWDPHSPGEKGIDMTIE